MNMEFIRTLRTPHSERYLLTRDNSQDIGALDVHYRIDGTAAATLILFQEATIPDSEVPGILKRIDEILFPDISMGEKNLFFTVVRGSVLGTFLPAKQDNPE
jgi:hypothetical protein